MALTQATVAALLTQLGPGNAHLHLPRDVDVQALPDPLAARYGTPRTLVLDRTELGPDAFAGARLGVDTPAGRQGVDQEEPAPAVGIARAASVAITLSTGRRGGLEPWEAFASGVGEFDTDHVRPARQVEREVPSGHAAVEHCVGGEFGDDQRRRIGEFASVRDPPRVELLDGEPSREPGTSAGGAEALAEGTDSDGDLGLSGVRRCHGGQRSGRTRSSARYGAGTATLYRFTVWTGSVTNRNHGPVGRMGQWVGMREVAGVVEVEDTGAGVGAEARCAEPEPSESLRTFGAVHKALREKCGLTQEAYAEVVGYSVHAIAKLEQGKRFPQPRFIERAGTVLEAPGVLRAASRNLTRKQGLASWFQQWAGIEEEAVSLYTYECRAIPGLLQPEPYIRAIFERRLPPLTEEQIERQVEARLERQRLLVERPNTAFCFIVEQALLERRLGGRAVTRALIDHLLLQSERRNVEIQVMPLIQEDHAGFEGLAYLAESPHHQWFGYIESQDSSVLISEPQQVSSMLQRYGKMRGQALNCQSTHALLEQIRGAL